MASGRFETKCIGPLETVSLACNSGTVATVTLTATAISTDQNACLSISMSDVPTCPEFTSCLGNIGTGMLGTLTCLVAPAINCNSTYGGYRRMIFCTINAANCCQRGPYFQHYTSANTAFQGCTNPAHTVFRHCPFNIPPAIESLCYSLAARNCCCSKNKGLNAMLIPREASAGGYWAVKKCCFQRFGGTLTDDCYYQLVAGGTPDACDTLSCSLGTPTPFGGFMRYGASSCGCDIAVDWWHNSKPIWGVNGNGQVCSPTAIFLNEYHTAGCAPWVQGDDMDGPCHQQSATTCTLNNYPAGAFCSFPYGSPSATCCARTQWGFPTMSIDGFFPKVMTGCGLQVYQDALAGHGVQFKSSMCTDSAFVSGGTTWWCIQNTPPTPAQYDNQCCVGLRIAASGSGYTSLGPTRAHNFVRWMTYNQVNCQNYFMWYHECTPVMNGIYSVSEAQSYCIYRHMTSCNIEACNAGSFQCGDAIINTKFATRLSCVPAIFCGYGKAWCMLNTNAFASGQYEWSMFISPNDWQCTNNYCFCRFISNDLVNWRLGDTSGCRYIQERVNTPLATCYVEFNATNCNFECACSNYFGIPSANAAVLEHFTSTGKLERSGIVMGATDRFYVRNTSNSISASVTVWGFNE